MISPPVFFYLTATGAQATMAILHVLSLAAAFVLGAAPSPAYAETDATTYPPLTGKIYHYPDQIVSF